jgi:hypothetical protein
MPVVFRLIYEERPGGFDGASRRGLSGDVVAIDEQSGRLPDVRLNKNVFRPAM